MTNEKQSWSDSQGRTWSTAIKAIDAVRLRDVAGVDLLDPNSMESIFGADPLKRVETMGELAREQWQRLDLRYEDFADAILSTPTSFIDATAALRVSIADFFRRLGREDLAAVVDRAWQVMQVDRQMRIEKANGEKVGKILQAAADQSAADVDASLDAALDKIQIRGKRSGSSVDSAVPTGDR
jgi:hypothetical protein